MPGYGHGNKAAGDGDFANKYSKGGAGTGHGKSGAKPIKSGYPPYQMSHGMKGHGKKGGMSYGKKGGGYGGGYGGDYGGGYGHGKM